MVQALQLQHHAGAVDKTMTPEDLIDFEQKIAESFNKGFIRSPIHLCGGGEEDLIRIFRYIRSNDWVLCGWRSHYHCLLKGVPRWQLEQAILAGNSIALCFPAYRILSSAIVGGVLPIAVGLGMGIKRDELDTKVYCFMGDMTAESGIAYECMKYVQGHDLPVRFIIEDNGLSVCTDTKKVWGIVQPSSQGALHPIRPNTCTDYFEYKPGRYPHSGSGTKVDF
jgi:TPP-dependent pyruvate/acetoin dehydrogenase alpha subunit